MRCPPGPGGRRWASPLNSWVVAVVLALPLLVLPTAPAGAADEMWALSNPRGTRIAGPTVSGTILGRDGSPMVWRASFGPTAASWPGGRSGEHPRAGVRDSQVLLGGLRIALRRSREEGERAGVANIDGGRWRDWIGGDFAHVADDGGTRTGSQGASHPDLLLGSWFLFVVGDSAAPDGHRSGGGHAAPARLTGAHGRSSKGLVCPFGVDCERARLLAGAAPSPVSARAAFQRRAATGSTFR